MNPLGLAAGYDKEATGYDLLLGLGFSFVEVGTITPLPQSGNPPPTFFHLQEDQAVINRQGFPNPGYQAVLERLKGGRNGIVGVNIGPNRNSLDRIAEYVNGVKTFNSYCDYITINISSPNTVGLRDLQKKSALLELLGEIVEIRCELTSYTPLLVKISPDLSSAELRDVAEACLDSGVDGIIISNTTVSREKLKSHFSSETGGLSGLPLFNLSTQKLAQMYVMTNGSIPLIGVGGIHSAETAWEKIRAGASLLQIGTAFRFKGPELLCEIVTGLRERLHSNGYSSITEVVGTNAAEWAKEERRSQTIDQAA